MKPPTKRVRFYFYGASFVLSLTVLGTSFAQNEFLEDELNEIADTKIAELREPFHSDDDFAVVVTAAKEYVLFGGTTGKITVYIWTEDYEWNGVANPHAHGPISGVEYYLVRAAGEWDEQESSLIGAEQCQTEGAEAFRGR